MSDTTAAPVAAAPVAAPAPTSTSILSKVLGFLDELDKFVMAEAPVAQAIAPLTGQYAPAVAGAASLAGLIAGMFDSAYQKNLGGGVTTQGGVAASIDVINQLAANPTAAAALGIDTTKLTTIATAASTALPGLQALVTSITAQLGSVDGEGSAGA